jgi:hypothetical protein
MRPVQRERAQRNRVPPPHRRLDERVRAKAAAAVRSAIVRRVLGSGRRAEGSTESSARARPWSGCDRNGNRGWNRGDGRDKGRDGDGHDGRGKDRDRDWDDRREERGGSRTGAAVEMPRGTVAGGSSRYGCMTSLPGLNGEVTAWFAGEEGVCSLSVVVVIISGPFDGVNRLVSSSFLGDDALDKEVGPGGVGPERHGVRMGRRTKGRITQVVWAEERDIEGGVMAREGAREVKCGCVGVGGHMYDSEGA